MKIVIASGIFIPELGGPATYAKRIGEEFVARGHSVHVLTFSDVENHEDDSTYSFSVSRVVRRGILSNYLRYFSTLWRISKGCDVVYAFDHMSAGIPSALVSTLRRVRFAIRIGGDFIWERYLRLNSEEAVGLREYYEKELYREDKRRFRIIAWVFRKAHRLVFTTRFQGEIFQQYYRFEKKKISYISNPLPGQTQERQVGVPEKEIFFAGRVISKNNVRRLIDAFVSIEQAEYTLTIVGSGEEKNKLQQYVQETHAQGGVHFEPPLSRSELSQRMRRVHAMVFPSLTDISPNTLLECLAVKVPFVTSKEIGYDWLLPQVIHFDPRDTHAIAEALRKIMDSNVYPEYKEKIENITYTYTFEEAAKDTEEIFQALL